MQICRVNSAKKYNILRNTFYKLQFFVSWVSEILTIIAYIFSRYFSFLTSRQLMRTMAVTLTVIALDLE